MSKARPLLLILVFLLTITGTAHAGFGDTILRRGTQGGDVWQLQQYLHELGLLSVQPTGHFGELTDAAVRQFQAQNGLAVDGLVGPQTAGALIRTTATRWHIVQAGDTLWSIARRYSTDVNLLKTVNGLSGDLIYPGQRLRLSSPTIKSSRGNFSRSELELLAQLVHAEAVGEPYLGKVAVAAVVLNRIDSPQFPNTIRAVLFQPYQFEPVLNGKIYNGYTPEDMRATMEAVAGSDPTNGALFFYNPGKVSHKWMAARQVQAVIGQHVFSR